MLLLTITLHDTTKCCDLSLWQCFTGIYVYAYLTVQSSLVSEGRLKPTFHFRYCGTIKDLTSEKGHRVLSMDCFHLLIGLSGLELFLPLFFFPYCKRSWCFSSLYLHQNVALTFFVLLRCIFHFVKRTSAFYSWSSIVFILPDLYPFRYLVITLPCLKKKKKKELIERKEIKQLWFLKCTVDCVFSLCHIKIMHQILVKEIMGRWFQSWDCLRFFWGICSVLDGSCFDGVLYNLVVLDYSAHIFHKHWKLCF